MVTVYHLCWNFTISNLKFYNNLQFFQVGKGGKKFFNAVMREIYGDFMAIFAFDNGFYHAGAEFDVQYRVANVIGKRFFCCSRGRLVEHGESVVRFSCA